MLNQPAPTTRQLGRYLLAVALSVALSVALALGCSAARAQTPLKHPSPMAVPAGMPVYLDGQASTAAVVEKLDTSAVASIDVLQGMQARFFTHSKNSHAIILITKANQSSAAVRELDRQERQAEAAVVKMEEGDLPAPAQEYVAQQYPDYRLVDVDRVAPTNGEPLRYQVIMAKGRRPAYLLFDAAGKFLEVL